MASLPSFSSVPSLCLLSALLLFPPLSSQQEVKSLEHREAEAKDKAQRLLTRARHETGVNSPEENAELMQVGGCVGCVCGGE